MSAGNRSNVITFDQNKIWGIDVSTVSSSDKKRIVNVAHLLRSVAYYDTAKLVKAQTCALQLLKAHPTSADYAFLCAICYDGALTYARISDDDTLPIDRFQPLPYNAAYYRQQAQSYFIKALQIHPNHPVYLLYFGGGMHAILDLDLIRRTFNRLNALLKDKVYALKYKNHKQIVCWDSFLCLFQYFLYTQTERSAEENKNAVKSLFPVHTALLDKDLPTTMSPAPFWCLSMVYSCLTLTLEFSCGRN